MKQKQKKIYKILLKTDKEAGNLSTQTQVPIICDHTTRVTNVILYQMIEGNRMKYTTTNKKMYKNLKDFKYGIVQ